MRKTQDMPVEKQAGGEPGADVRSRTLWQEAWRRFKKNKVALAGLCFLGVLLVISIATLLLDLATGNAIYDAKVINMDLAFKLEPPSTGHILGQDEFGRDIFMRILWGARYSLFLGVATVAVAAVIGSVLGALAGFYEKLLDNAVMRVMDVLLAIPSMLLAISLVAALGTSLFNIVLAIAISYVPTFARVVRASVMSVKEMEFIEASRSYGANDARIIFKYILPNSLAPLIVQATLSVANAILMIASLSFMGLGIEPPMPEWGAMLANARTYIRDAWHITLFPGLAIMLTILSLNLVGDGLRDALDPKLKD